MSTSSNVTDANDGMYPLPYVPHIFMGGMFCLKKVISNGEFSAVYAAYSFDDVDRELKFAIKIPKFDKEVIKKELAVFKEFEFHQNLDVVPKLLEDHVNHVNIPFIVYSLEGPSLEAIAGKSSDGKIEKGLLMRLSCHALLALKKLHSMNILHCNISPTSFLLRANGNPQKMKFVLLCGLNDTHNFEDRRGKRVPCKRDFSLDAFTSWPSSKGQEYKERDELMAMAHTMLHLGGFYNFVNPTDETRDMRERLYYECKKTFKDAGEPVYYDIFSSIFKLRSGKEVDYMRIYNIINKHKMYDRKKSLNQIVDEFS